MSSHLPWYIARASGFVAWGLLTASVLWGVSFSSRFTRRPKPAWVLDLHRFLGGAAVVFVGVHIGALATDRYVGFSVADLFVPFAASWKPGELALGVVAFYLLLSVELTSLMMRRLPRKLWHAVHFASYLVFVLTVGHALTAGTDAGEEAVQWFALVSVGAVAFMTLFRALAERRSSRASLRTADARELKAAA